MEKQGEKTRSPRALAGTVLTSLLATAPAWASPLPLISDALGCGTPASVGILAPGDELQRLDLELGVFPDAVCNDGSGALFYFRPHAGPANANRWVIQLQGGGSCGSPDECADRWCSVGTGLGMTQMSSQADPPPAAIDGLGILDERPANPLGRWNHVFVRYCSSDGWSGTARDVEVAGEHPVSGSPVAYRIHFLGRPILEAALDTLRRDGVGAPIYEREGAGGAIEMVAMPDLDEAERVIVVGASAGGSGVTANADHLEALLQASSACSGPDCPLQVRVLIDSAFPPALEGLDFSETEACVSQAACDWQSYLAETAAPSLALWQAAGDESCDSWHQAASSEWQCQDLTHVIRHHVTTPMFVRMGQHDSLFSEQYVESALRHPVHGPIELDVFAALVREELGALADVQTTGDEGSAVGVTPGAFGPTCSKHETLRSNAHTFRTRIEVAGAWPSMPDVLASWIQGGPLANVVTPPGGEDFCPGEEALPAASAPGRVALILLLVAAGLGRVHELASRRA